jgi:hypothetical protein
VPTYEEYVAWRGRQKGMPILSQDAWLAAGRPGPQTLGSNRNVSPPNIITLPETDFPVPGAGGPQDPALIEKFADLKAILARYGLEQLDAWAWQKIVDGASVAQIELELYEQQAFRDRFAAIFEFRKKFPDLPAPSPADILGYETAAAQLYKAAGLPVGFYDQPQDFVNLIGGGVSMAELTTRVQEGFEAAMKAPAEVRTELERLYGIQAGALAAFFLDPDKALPLLVKQFGAAQISGAGFRAGYDPLTVGQAERLADLGLTPEQAGQGFGELVRMEELFQPLPGREAAEVAISTEEQLGAAFGGVESAQARIERQRRARLAVFGGGGGFAAGEGGISGIGVAR